MPPHECIRYVRSADGVRIAWAESGGGPRTLVCTANHVTDIKTDAQFANRFDSIQRLNRHFRVIRYDYRGTGSSQRNMIRQGQDAWIEDLKAVMDAANAGEPCILFAPSQSSPYGAAFAAEHPELVSHLILHGAYDRGALVSEIPEVIARTKATLELIRIGWDTPNPGSRMLVATSFFPEPGPAEVAWAERLPQMMNAGDALRFFQADAEQDARKHLPKVRAPTLVMATSHDTVVLPEWTRLVAAAIPGAQYVELPGKNHIPIPSDPSFEPFFEHLLAFVSAPGPKPDRLAGLSPRERDILDGVCAGLSNEAIALQRNISIKTVRNHLSHIFDKLRVNSRTQAALLAVRPAGQAPRRSVSA